MDIIDYELKRYDTMKNDLETRKNPDATKPPARDSSRSSDFLDTLMNEEKPKDVRNKHFQITNYEKLRFVDGTTTSSNTRAKTTSKIRKLVESIFEHDLIVTQS